MNYNWNWGIFLQTVAGRHRHLPRLCCSSGSGWTLATALCAWVIALVARLASSASLRTTAVRWAVRLGNAYVELFRNIPLLVQMFLWYFVLPELLPTRLGDAIKQMPPPGLVRAGGASCLGFFTSARVAEQVRAGIQSLPRGQRMAGTAMGLTLPQTYRYVLLPMAFRIILPPLTTEFMNIIKNSSVALTIGLLELTGARARDAGIHLPGLRGVHRRDRALPRHQPRRGHAHALCSSSRSRVPGFIGRRRSRTAGHWRCAPASTSSVIQRSLPLPVPGGHDASR